MDNYSNGDRNGATEPYLSRQEYRRQQEERERQAKKEQPTAPEPSGEEINSSRQEAINEERQTEQEAKTNRLKKRLNIAILCLILAIVAVYLILFFVG